MGFSKGPDSLHDIFARNVGWLIVRVHRVVITRKAVPSIMDEQTAITKKVLLPSSDCGLLTASAWIPKVSFSNSWLAQS